MKTQYTYRKSGNGICMIYMVTAGELLATGKSFLNEKGAIRWIEKNGNLAH